MYYINKIGIFINIVLIIEMASNGVKAYIIGGHGSEGEDSKIPTFIVPKGCMIVVKNQCGSYGLAYQKHQRGIASLSPAILKDPIGNYTTIANAIGDYAIYKEGQVCPNFSYTLLGCYPDEQTGKYTGCNSIGSGLIDVDRLYEDNDLIAHMRKNGRNRQMENRNAFKAFNSIPPKDEFYHYIAQLYKNSVFPTTSQIEKLMDAAKKDYQTKYSGVDRIIKTLDSKLRGTTQNGMCNKFKGIYYNLVCRAVKRHDNLRISYGIDWTKSNQQAFLAPNRTLLRRNNDFKMPSNKELKAMVNEEMEDVTEEDMEDEDMSEEEYRNTIKKSLIKNYQVRPTKEEERRIFGTRISEAEQQRKPYIKLKYNTRVQNAGKRSKRRKTRKSRK
jgi:hypothetical protein